MFRALFDACPDVILVRRRDDGAIAFANQAYARLFGGAPERGQPWRSRIEPSSRALHEHAVHSGGEPAVPVSLGDLHLRDSRGVIHRMRHAVHALAVEEGELSGRYWIEVLHDSADAKGAPGGPLDVPQPSAFHLIGVGRDVAEGDAAPWAQRASDARFEELVRSLPDVPWLFDVRRRCFDFVGPGFEAAFGRPRPPESETWASLRAWIHPDDVERAAARLDALLAPGAGMTELECRVRLADGTVRWLHSRALPVRDELGVVVQVAGLSVDVTARNLEQAQLRESEERLRRMSETMRDAFYLASPDAKVLYHANDAITHITGLPRAQLFANPHRFFDALHPEDRPRAWAMLERVQREGELIDETRIDLRVVRPNGEVRWVESWTWPVFDENGRLRQMVGTLRDVTDRRAAEAALRERTEQLERSLLEKTVLLAEIHHRVNNNLQAVAGLVHLMAAQARHRPLAETVADLEQRIQAMALVHETLYRSADLAAVDMSAYLKRLGDALIAAIRPGEASITLIVEARRDTTLDVESAVRCGLIANELISNALEHAFVGRTDGLIEVTLRRAGDGLLLRVSDDGVGLSPSLDFNSEHTLGLRLVSGLAAHRGGFVRRVPGTDSAIEVLCGGPG